MAESAEQSQAQRVRVPPQLEDLFHRHSLAVAFDDARRKAVEQSRWQPKLAQQREFVQLSFQRLDACRTGVGPKLMERNTTRLRRRLFQQGVKQLLSVRGELPD